MLLFTNLISDLLERSVSAIQQHINIPRTDDLSLDFFEEICENAVNFLSARASSTSIEFCEAKIGPAISALGSFDLPEIVLKQVFLVQCWEKL